MRKEAAIRYNFQNVQNRDLLSNTVNDGETSLNILHEEAHVDDRIFTKLLRT
jgi:hypothetical protein